MDIDVKDFLLYLIDNKECDRCKFEDKCCELENRGEHCICDVAYKDLAKR